MDQTLEKYSKD